METTFAADLPLPKPRVDDDLKTAGNSLLTKLDQLNIALMPLTSPVHQEQVLAHYKDAHPEEDPNSLPTRSIIACDFYIKEAERGLLEPYGLRGDKILNLDHHAPITAMQRHISSGNLACTYVRSNGPVASKDWVVVNHTDCDSIISSLIIRGHLPPLAIFENAVIAADHTGARDEIADLLQALDRKRDIKFSVRNLALLLAGKELDPEAVSLLQDREEMRQRAEVVVDTKQYELKDGVAFFNLDQYIYSEFLPPILPDAELIMLALPLRKDPTKKEVKLRLGLAAPEGLSLHDLKIFELDPGFNGRWNAGANSRGGGTLIDPNAYASWVRDRLTGRI